MTGDSLSLSPTVNSINFDDAAGGGEYSGGYPREIFRSANIDPKWLCSQCSLVLRNPRQVPCGHRYCATCVTDMTQRSDNQLIECRACKDIDDVVSTFAPSDVFPDNALMRVEFPKTKVFCVSPGCQWTGSLRDYEGHRKSCPNAPVTCDVCRKTQTRAEYEAHTRNGHPCPLECGKTLQPGTSLESHVTCDVFGHLRVISGRTEQVERSVLDMATRLDSIERKMPTLEVRRKDATDSAKDDLPSCQSRGASSSPTDAEQQMTSRFKTIEDAVVVLSREVDVVSQRADGFSGERQKPDGDSKSRALEVRIRQLEQTLAARDATVEQLTKAIQYLEQTSYDGDFVWRISEVTRRRREAKNGTMLSFFSQPFYSSRSGYKMCARVYMNGDGVGRGTHLSAFFVVMRGDYDAILQWPFRQRVSISVIAHTGSGQNVTDAFRPDPTSSSFRRPTSDMNIASGFPQFMQLDELDRPNNPYVKDDTMFVRITVTALTG